MATSGLRGYLDTQKSQFLREIMHKEEQAFEEFHREYYQLSPEDVAAQKARQERHDGSADRERQQKIATMKTALRKGDTDAVRISKELWSKLNPSFDSSSSTMASNAQEAMDAVYDPENLDGIHTIKVSKRNNRRKNDFTEYVEANARYAQMSGSK